jgi:iron(III) transport system substrate-binding protein
VVAAVNRGAVATGIINSYYWARLRVETGASAMHADIYHFRHGDVGALINVSGAAVMKSAPHPAAAQRFLAYLVGDRAQRLLGRSDVDFEYPLRPGVPANPILRPFSLLEPPAITVAGLGDDQQAAALLQQAGLL